MADEDGGVRVIRRDGVNLILTREDRVDSAGTGAVIAARIMRHFLAKQPMGDVMAALLKEFPWIKQLPAADLEAFLDDFVDSMLAAAELMQWGIVDQVFREWKTTAAIYADRDLAARLAEPLNDDLGPVPSPTATSSVAFEAADGETGRVPARGLRSTCAGATRPGRAPRTTDVASDQHLAT